MGKLKWECNGIEINLSDDEKANIFCDVDNLPCSVTGSFDRRSAPGMQGTNTYAASLSGMQITISGVIMARNMGSQSKPVDMVLEDYRKLLCNAFNPLFVGKLTRIIGGGLYFAEARANSTPIFDTAFGGTLPFSVDLYADEPYWKLDDKRVIDIGPSDTEAVYSGETQEMGEVLSISAAILNQSKTDQYPIVRFWPTANKPILRNKTTGKILTLNQQITGDFYVDVDTYPSKNTVELYKKKPDGSYEAIENVSYWLSVDSSQDYYLVPGLNEMVVENAAAGVYPAVSLIWYERELIV